MATSRIALVLLAGALAFPVFAGPPKGKPAEPSADEAKALAAFKDKLKAKIAWSSSRGGNHLIYIMNADGSDVKAVTAGKKTDWFCRFSPDGIRLLFTRSKMDWTPEPNADNPQMWDTWIVNADGSDEKLLIPNSTWATWRPDGKTLVFARGGKVFTFEMETGRETLLLDGEAVLKKGVVLQNPHLSPGGDCLAVTLRGSMRETGIFNLAKKEWTRTGEGCQINWFPAGDRVVRMNPTGNGGSQVLSFPVKDCRPVYPDQPVDQIKFMDLPGRRSHEYFPQISPDGRWMVWCATQRGHDHDMADYEVYIWDIHTPQDQAVRLSFHSGNDRWPDIYL